MRRQPTLRFVPPYFDDPIYIEALASSLEAALGKLSWKPEVDACLVSRHTRRNTSQKGDPYADQCVETTRLLREPPRLDEREVSPDVSVALRPRRMAHDPTTDQTVRELAQSGVKNLAVVMPGFSADCLETLEEIAVENARNLPARPAARVSPPFPASTIPSAACD